jgi:hypothetical protein
MGCSTLKVSNDYNPKYDFKKLRSFVVLYNTKIESLNQERIAKALTHELELKGYSAAPKDKADFYVVFHTNVTKKTQIVQDYRTIGVPFSGYRHAYWHSYTPVTVSTSRAYNYKEGKLVVDILDGKTKKIFWTATAKDRLESYKTPEERRDYIKTVAEKLLKSFPAKGKPA